jgi:hypothetical protein
MCWVFISVISVTKLIMNVDLIMAIRVINQAYYEY